MKRFYIVLILINFLLSFFIFPRAIAGDAQTPFIPPDGKTLLFIGEDRQTIAHYVGATHSAPGGMMFYTSLKDITSLDHDYDVGGGHQYGSALLRSYPNSVMQIGLYMVDELGDILTGNYDDNIKKLGAWIKKANRPVYLRIGYEFDLPQNHYDPDGYKQAFCHIVDLLRNEGVHNAAYVWHSYSGQEVPNNYLMSWYPGDDYVDWFGSTVFSTYQIGEVSRFIALAREHHKPFMFAESTPESLYIVRSKLEWYKHIFSFILEQKVEAFCYINSNWEDLPMFKGQSWGDARIEQNSEIKKMWLEEINGDHYLKASKDLFKSLGWQ